MPDVFISYSRKDKTFVQRLHGSLAALQRDVWIDWEDIPLTADWWHEICAGIEAADTFVCVISPDFAQSEVCQKEVEHAFANKKRFVPVLFRELDTMGDAPRIHPAIGAHNWIFIRPQDDYDAAFNALVLALDTDLAHVRSHTRLLVRAVDWNTKNRDTNLLLRGSDLKEAEAWLTAGSQKQPEPSPIHIEYISFSRQAATLRQRLLLISVSMALLVSTGLALLSFVLFRQSEANRDEALHNAATAVALRVTAEYSSDVSLSAALAARSQLELERAPEFALLLALDALENSAYTTQAEAALGLAVQSMRPRLLVEPRDNQQYISIAWSPEGAQFAGGDIDGHVYVWDSVSGEEMVHWQEVNVVRGLEWSPDGKRIGTVTDDGYAYIRNAKTGEELFQLDGDARKANFLAWSPDGTAVLTGGYDGGIIIWDTETGMEKMQVIGAIGAWSPDGQKIASANRSSSVGQVYVWDAATGVEQVSFAAMTYALDWSPDGTRIVTVGVEDDAHVWDAQTGDELMQLVGHADSIFNVDWSGDGRYIVTGSGSESGFDITVRIWDGANGEQLAILPGTQREPRWSPRSTRILTIDEDFGVSAWSAFQDIGQYTYYGHSGGISDVDWSPDSQWVVTASDDGTAQIWNPYTGGLRSTLHHQRSVRSANWSPDGRWILTAGFDNTVRIWDVETGAERVHIDAFDDWVEYAAWSPDATRIVTVSRTDPSMNVWQVDPENGTAQNLSLFSTSTLDSPQFNYFGYAMVGWSPDGTRLIASSDISTFVFDATTGAELFTLPGAGRGVAWSAEGRYALTTVFRLYNVPDEGTDNTIRVWDMAVPGRAVRTLAGHTNVVWRADWSPNGQRILSASNDNTAKVWDAATGDELLTLRGHDGFVQDAAWSPDGLAIVTVSADGTARIWPAWQTTAALVDYANRLYVSRTFTVQETGQLNRMRSPGGDG